MMTNDDRPTYWSIHERDITQLRVDMREGFQAVNARLDRMPTSEMLLMMVNNLQDKLTDVEEENEKLRKSQDDDRSNRRRERQWIIGAVAVPIGLLVLNLVAQVAGWTAGG